MHRNETWKLVTLVEKLADFVRIFIIANFQLMNFFPQHVLVSKLNIFLSILCVSYFSQRSESYYWKCKCQ